MKTLLWLLLVFLTASASFAQTGDETSDPRFDRVADLRSRGEFDVAIDLLTACIRDTSVSNQILRRAYSELVWTIMAKSDKVSDRAQQTGDAALRDEIDSLTQRLGEIVGEALGRFPDIRADEAVLLNASRVNQMYETPRHQMFGTLVVISDPESAVVWINDEKVGWKREGVTPLTRDLFPVGDYEIRLTRKNFHDESLSTRIQPYGEKEHNVVLRRKRSKTWWVTRVVVPAASAVGILVYALTSGEDAGQPEPEPLPLPPDPPE